LARKSLAEPSAPRAARAPRPWLLLCCVAVVLLATYLPVLGAPLIWDDVHLIERTPLVQTLHPLHEYFRQGFWQGDDLTRGSTYYRPLTTLSLALDCAVYGNTPAGFHLTNLAIHLASTGLLFWLLRIRGCGGYAAMLGSALWALHPRLTEAVAWISGRTDLLATFFVLCALLVRARAGSVRRTVSALLLLLGLLCKEVALAGVAAVLVEDWLAGGPVAARLRRMLPTGVALAVYAVLRESATDGTAPAGHSLARQAVLAAAAIGRYLVMLLTPWFPSLQIGSLDHPGIFYPLLGCATLIAAGYWAVRGWSRIRKEQLPSLLLMLVGLGLVLHLVPIVVKVVAADRFLYLPLIGLTLLLAPVDESRHRRLLLAGSALAVSFAAATFVRTDTWSDEVKLWTETYQSNPDNQLISCSELGRLYARVGLLEHAFSIDEGCHDTSYNRRSLSNNAAAVLARSGRFDAAIREIARFAPAFGGEPVFGLNLALFRSYLADFSGARAELARILSVHPNYPEALELQKKLPQLERERLRADALPETTPAADKARAFAKVGLAIPALDAWRACLERPDTSRGQFEEALWFALAHGDAHTTLDFHRRYRLRFPEGGDPQLELAFTTQRDLAQRLLEAWPRLSLPLRSLPS
jgi:tetratricopeptide (TPR) repeat protein